MGNTESYRHSDYRGSICRMSSALFGIWSVKAQSGRMMTYTSMKRSPQYSSVTDRIARVYCLRRAVIGLDDLNSTYIAYTGVNQKVGKWNSHQLYSNNKWQLPPLVRNKQLCCRREAARCLVSVSSQLRQCDTSSAVFYCRAMRCISAAYVVMRCLSVCPSCL